MVYNLIYLDGKTGRSMIKRFQVLAVTRDKEYDLTTGNRGSKVLYFTANPNGEAEVVTVFLTNGAKARKKVFDFDFTEIDIKGRGSQGNILTRYPVRRIQLKSAGKSTLGGLDIWYDDSIGRLNTDSRGKYLGNYKDNDNILVIYSEGSYELTNYELTNRYDESHVLLIEKFDPEKVISTLYYDGESKNYFVKRFRVETRTIDKRFSFISEAKGSKLLLATTIDDVNFELELDGKGTGKSISLNFNELIDVKGWKAIGNKLPYPKISEARLIAASEEEESDGEAGTDGYKPGSSVNFDLKNPDDNDDQLELF
jgi:topoisomerase-4 subunit A